jgi:hypothetical protein
MRIVTMAEARNLPPPTPEELERHRQAMADIALIREAILARRGGVPIPWEDIEWALGDEDDDEDLAAK